MIMRVPSSRCGINTVLALQGFRWCQSVAASHEDVGVEYIVKQEKFHDSKQLEQLKRAHVDVVRAVVQ